jgi:hypothetical protein
MDRFPDTDRPGAVITLDVPPTRPEFAGACYGDGVLDRGPDFTGDDALNGRDLSIVLGFWGTLAKALPVADPTDDGNVDATDLAEIPGS